MSGELILIVEDEANIVQLDKLYLEKENYRVQSAGDGNAGLVAILNLKPNLVVLDVMLPIMDGLTICQNLRAANNQVPIILATARDEDIDKILGLELGADDYLTKPYNPRELVARVKAVLRRSGPTTGELPSSPIRFADLTIYPERREVLVNNTNISLRTQEFEVLLILASKPGIVFDRERLLKQAWGFDFYGQTRTVDVHIAKLRKKLETARAKIETIPGVGYKMVEV
jgi:DNA-binding response OmpR family regulator